MGKEQVISKGKYAYAQPEDMVSVKQYLFVKDENGKKQLLLRFCNNKQEKCSKFVFILYRLDAKGNILGQDKYESADRIFKEKEVFSFDRKIAVEERCTDFKVQMVYARYGNYTYNVEHNDVSVTYSEKNTKSLNNARSFAKAKPRKIHERTFDMPWIFVVLSMIILALSFAACGLLLNNYKAIKEDFTLSGVKYKFVDKELSGDVEIVGCVENYREVTLNNEIEGHKVVGINKDAFTRNQNLLTLTINNLDIPAGAFQKCTNLQVVTINGATSIGKSAFEDCTSLSTVRIVEGEPGQYVQIGSKAFGDCKSLKTVEIAQNIQYGEAVDFFAGSKNIESLKLRNIAFTVRDVSSNYVTRVASLFGENNKTNSAVNLVNLTIDNMDSIPDSFARGFKNLRSVYIGGGEIKSVGSYAFEGCTALSSLTMNGQLTSIGSYAFAGTDIPYLDMSKVEYLGNGIFKDDDKLTSVYGFGQSGINSVPAETFMGCTSLTQFEIHQSVKHIYSSAFEGAGLVKLEIPQGVSYDFGILRGCNQLRELKIYEFGAAGYVGNLFGADRNSESNVVAKYISPKLEKIELGTGTVINKDAFKGCSNVTTITLPHEIEVIGAEAFSGCSKLVVIDIPKESTTLLRIEDRAFKGCKELKYVPLLSSLEFIGENILEGCTKIEVLELPFFGATRSADSDETLAYLFAKIPDSLKEVYLFDTLMSEIPSDAFSGCAGIRKISIPNTIVSLGDEAFKGCKSLTTIILSDGTSANKAGADLSRIISIGESAFEGCSAMSTITFSDEIEVISQNAFKSSGIKTISIPESVNFIGEGVFASCEGLASLTLPYLGSTRNSENGTVSYLFDGNIPSSLSVVTVEYVKNNKLGANAFANAKGLVSVNLPQGIIEIGEDAFNGCEKLSTFNFETVNVVRARAFNGCYKLKGIDLSKVSSIGESAFSGCTSLVSINLENATTIDRAAFYDCKSLISVTFSESLSIIEDKAFSKSGLKAIEFPNRVSYIEEGAFADCEALIDVKLSQSLYFIGSEAFKNTAIKQIAIPGSVTIIGSKAFSGTKLESIVIPGYVQELGEDVFSECANLTVAEFPITYYGYSDASVAAFLFGGSFPESLKKVVINGVREGFLARGAFANAKYLEEVIINADITSIGDYAFMSSSELRFVSIPSTVRVIGTGAFDECYRLYEIANASSCPLSVKFTIAYSGSLENRAPTVEKDGYKFALYNDEWYLIAYPNGEKISTPKSFTYWDETINEYKIPSYLFYKKGIKEVEVNSATSLGNDSFAFCNSLKSVSLNNSITSIGNGAFNGCTALKTVKFPTKLETIGSHAFYECVALNDVKLYSNVYYIGEEAFRYCSSLFDVYSIGNNLNLVAGSCDNGYVARRAVKIHTDITEALAQKKIISGIGTFMYSGNAWLLIEGAYNITNLNLSQLKVDDITIMSYRIGEKAFYSNSSLVSVTIGNEVKQIQEGAFAGCTNMTVLDCSANSSIKEIEAGTFKECLRLKTVKLPSSVKTIGQRAFLGCTMLTYLTMPTELETIGEEAFYDCLRLISVTLNADVRSIGDNAFAGCNYLVEVYDLTSHLYVVQGTSSYGGVAANAAEVFTSASSSLPRSTENGAKLIKGGSTYYVYDYAESGASIVTLNNNGGKIVIMPYAFRGGKLSGIVLPTNVSMISSSAFNGCGSFSAIYYSGNSSSWSKVEGAASYSPYYYKSCVHYGDSMVWTYAEENGVKKVSTSTCPEIKEITKAATCYERGTTTYICECCNYRRTVTEEILDHKFGIDNVCKNVGCGETKVKLTGKNIESYVTSGVIELEDFVYDSTTNKITSTNKEHDSSSAFIFRATERTTLSFTLEASSQMYSDYLHLYRYRADGSLLSTESVTGRTEQDFFMRLEAGEYIVISYEKDSMGSSYSDCGYIVDMFIIQKIEQASNEQSN